MAEGIDIKKIMKCGHKVSTYELIKSDGIVSIRYQCEKDCWSDYATIGEAPYPDEVDMT